MMDIQQYISKIVGKKKKREKFPKGKARTGREYPCEAQTDV